MKIPDYEGKRFFCIGNAKLPGRCRASGWSCGVDQLYILKDNKTRQLVYVHRDWLSDYANQNDPDPNRQMELFSQKEENLRQLKRLKELLDSKGK